MVVTNLVGRSHWPRGLRRRSASACVLRLWVRIPPGEGGAWMSVCCECCVLSGRGLCDGLITRPEESYRLWCVVVCDIETWWMRPRPTGRAVAPKEKEESWESYDLWSPSFKVQTLLNVRDVKKIKLQHFGNAENFFFLAWMKVHWDYGGGRLLQGDNTGWAVTLRPIRLQCVKSLDFNCTPLYVHLQLTIRTLNTDMRLTFRNYRARRGWVCKHDTGLISHV